MSSQRERVRQGDGVHYKDATLAKLAEHANVAQFVSFGPGAEPRIRYAQIADGTADELHSVEEAVGAVLDRATDRAVNVRSFDPNQPRGHEFLYGLTDPDQVAKEVRRLATGGLHTIVNETIDVNDGGVSGVFYAGIIEFAPGDTPRCVDKPGTASFAKNLGLRVLETVYGFRPELDYPDEIRVEFSIHPRRRGVSRSHTLIWEQERTDSIVLQSELSWPNRFSRFIGDKAFGLLVADALGLPVPATTVVARTVPPFRFGRPTGSSEYWTRTCPAEQVPGRFTTARGWIDPFGLVATEDPAGDAIVSVLAQENVDARYSGAAIATGEGVVVEGVAGTGDEFMLGAVAPESLPKKIIDDVMALHARARQLIGAPRLEWVHDGETVWVLQLHRGAAQTRGLTIYPGQASRECRFDVAEGLEALRALVERVRGRDERIVLVGDVGLTSHFGDVLRRARVPSRLERAP